MVDTEDMVSIPVASAGNLVSSIKDRDFFVTSGGGGADQLRTKWFGNNVYAGSVTIADPFGVGGSSYGPGAPSLQNTTTANNYVLYDFMQDSMTYNTGVKRVIKDGTPITFAVYIRNRDASITDLAIDDRTPTTYEVRSKIDITWASTSAGAAISYATSVLKPAGTTSRAWYEPIGTDGWYRLYMEVIADSALTEDLRAMVQPNGNYGATSGEGCYLWGAEVQYGSLNVSSATRGDVRGDGDGGASFANGGLYMADGGIFDVETVVDVEHYRPIRRIPFASGHTYTSGILRQNRRRWRVTVRAVGHSRMQNIEKFFGFRNGMEHPFFFTLPVTDDGVGYPWVATASNGHTVNKQETVTVYFAEDNLQIEEVGPSRYDVSFSVEELLFR